MVALPNIVTNPSWYFDNGASTHVTNNQDNLSFKFDYHGHDKVTIGNGQGLCIQNIGYSSLLSFLKTLHLWNILHCPKITKNILSIFKFTVDNNVCVGFHQNHCFVKDKSSDTMNEFKKTKTCFEKETKNNSVEKNKEKKMPIMHLYIYIYENIQSNSLCCNCI